MRCASVVAVLFAATACLGADEPAKATRVIEGVKTTFPAKSIPAGVKLLVGVLDSCHDVSDGTVKYTADDLTKAKKGDHVRFEFPTPLKVEVRGKKLEMSEAVFADGVFWLVCGKDFVRCTKYSETMDRFQEWYRQTLAADAGVGAEAKPQPAKLWAGVSASSPNVTSNALFTVREAERLMIGFAVVNDGTDPVPFERGETELVVNGQSVAGFGDAFRDGPVWARLVPGKPFSASLGLGKHFAKPGVYKVQWRGKGFESAVLEFRVVGE